MKKEVEMGIMIPEKLPNINLMKDSMFLITDTENYDTDNSAAFGESTDSSGSDGQSDSGQPKNVQKYVVRASGIDKRRSG